MDVETSSERILPSENIISTIHSNIPSLQNKYSVDRSIDHIQTVEINPEPSDHAGLSPKTFIIHETPNYYLDLSTLLIDLKIKLCNGEGARGGIDAARAYFINNIIQTIWATIKVFINDTNIESNYNNRTLSNINHILTTPNLVVKERGIIQGAFEITPTTLTNDVTEDHTNHADIAIRKTFSKQEPIHIRGPLHLDIATCDKFLLDGLNLKIVLEPSSPNYIINANHIDDAHPVN